MASDQEAEAQLPSVCGHPLVCYGFDGRFFEGKLCPVFLKGFHIFILTVRGAALLPDFGRQPQR